MMQYFNHERMLSEMKLNPVGYTVAGSFITIISTVSILWFEIHLIGNKNSQVSTHRRDTMAIYLWLFPLTQLKKV